jgi:type IV pilus assembly protein PilW
MHMGTKKRIRGRVKYFRVNRGYTLVELLVALIVGLIVLGALYGVFTVQNKQLNKEDQMAEMQQNARMAMDMMSKEIVMAGYGASGVTRCSGSTTASATPCLGISTANADSISFSADLNENGSITLDESVNPGENIAYSVFTDPDSGVQSLCRASNGEACSSSNTIIDHVSSLAFTYRNSAGSATTNLADIRTIEITIETRTPQIDRDLGTFRTYTLTSNVTPRNLGTVGY